jgi:hypothetical protein
MKLSQCTFLQMLLRSGNIMACREVCDDLLPSPSPIEDLCLRITETPLQIDNEATVSTLGT